jgi:hypothetical protein
MNYKTLMRLCVMSRSSKAQRAEWACRNDITNQLLPLQDFQRNVRMHNSAQNVTDEVKKDRMLLDAEVREQFRNILEHVAANKLEHVQLRTDQENTYNEIQVVKQQGVEMRENIEQLHRLISQLSLGGATFSNACRAPLTDFDI